MRAYTPRCRLSWVPTGAGRNSSCRARVCLPTVALGRKRASSGAVVHCRTLAQPHVQPDSCDDVKEEQLTPEFLEVCNSQLQMLRQVLAHHGSLSGSVYVRVGASLLTGRLELQRAACIGDPGEHAQHMKDSVLIGGPGSRFTEETITSTSRLCLPSHGHVVLPLSVNCFLVGLLLLEGFTCTDEPALPLPVDPVQSSALVHLDCGKTSSADSTTNPARDPGQLPSTSITAERKVSLSVLGSQDLEHSDGSLPLEPLPGRDTAATFLPASTTMTPEDERLATLCTRTLRGACALELRSGLLAARTQHRTHRVRAALEGVRESTVTMRTMGRLLVPRLPAASAEADMAAVLLEQGEYLGRLGTELEQALEQAPAAAGMVPGAGPGVQDEPANLADVCHSQPAQRITQGALCSESVAEPRPERTTAMRAEAALAVTATDALQPQLGSRRPSSASPGNGGLRGSEGAACLTSLAPEGAVEADNDWLVLRSLDEEDVESLMLEGDSLDFGESVEGWGKASDDEGPLQPGPKWPPVAG